jgi:hypothetical protein
LTKNSKKRIILKDHVYKDREPCIDFNGEILELFSNNCSKALHILYKNYKSPVLMENILNVSRNHSIIRLNRLASAFYRQSFSFQQHKLLLAVSSVVDSLNPLDISYQDEDVVILNLKGDSLAIQEILLLILGSRKISCYV